MFKMLVCPCETMLCLVEEVIRLPLKVQKSWTERGESVIQRREREVLKRTGTLAGATKTLGEACVCVCVCACVCVHKSVELSNSATAQLLSIDMTLALFPGPAHLFIICSKEAGRGLRTRLPFRMPTQLYPPCFDIHIR